MSQALRKEELYASLTPPAWYVARVEREYRARDDLQKRLGRDAVWLPECRIVVSGRKRRFTMDGPLFPGYLFVRGVLTDQWLASVLEPDDVVDMLRMQSVPVAACERQMSKLQSLMAEYNGCIVIEQGEIKRGFKHAPDASKFEKGEPVRILEGPFADFNAIYVEPAGAERVKIMLDIFGRANELILHEASVEAFA